MALLAGFAVCPGAMAAVAINEVMTSNGATLTDENGDAPDWVELYNASAKPVNLEGWGLSDSPGRPFRWQFRNARVEPGGFLLIYASGKDRQPEPVLPRAPERVPGLVLWLRADAVATDDPAQVRRVGDSVFVRRWRNPAAAGGEARQEVASSQPLWTVQNTEGRPAVRFDGVNDRLDLPAPAGTNSFCLFVVYRTSQRHENDPEGPGGVGGTSGQRYLFGARHGGDLDAGMGLSVGTNGVAVYEHGSGYMPAVAASHRAVGLGLTLVGVNYDAGQPTLEVQGLSARVGTASTRRYVTAPTEIGAGAYGAFAGEVFEILVFNRALDTAERRALSGHLADRYELDFLEPRHTNFRLDAGGETLVLTAPDGRPVDRVTIPVVPRDVSYGRQPDGGTRWRFFVEPTPAGSNTTPGSVEFLEAPAFSHEGGFYSGPIELRLASATPGAEVRYTLDGSEPTPQSLLHIPPLGLRSRTGTPNDLSRVPTVPGGQPPQGEVFKAWVVRARAFKADSLPSATITRTFWITPLGRARYTVPVVSLAFERADFFDPEIGIYVPGNAPNGNYSQRGPEWERPVHVEFHETDGTLAFAQEADVKIHGNTSQGFPIKGLDLDGTGGRGRQPFRHRLFPNRARSEFEHFLLRPTGHDQPTAFMRDELMQSLVAETGAETQAARACVVFLNGEYWGLHYLKEKQDAEFVAWYADHPADDLDYLEGYAAARAGDTRHYDAMMAFITANSLANPEAYGVVEALLEVPNYLDYKACEIFCYRWDIGNHRLWRPRSPEGRWRWLQFDYDVGWGGFWAEQPAWEFNMLAATLTPDSVLHGHNNETTTFLFRRLMENPDARREFINRFADLLNTVFAPDHTVARINELAAVLAPEMAEHTRRWRAPASLGEWQTRVQYLRDYAQRRPAFARQHVVQQFGLRGTAQLSLAVAPPDRGDVRLNTLDLALDPTRPWTGVYFRGNPIRVTATPRAGYRFEGWDGLPGVTSAEVTLLLNGDLSLRARFVPIEERRPIVRAVRTALPNLVQIEVLGPPGASCRVEISSDLADWTRVADLALDGDGTAVWRPEITAASSRSFYRVRLP